ncbi:MAG: metalloprotease, partial [Flavobacteriaceae bacterium]|nr:metalloprotease [Flavobacteriaceae bacterium]
MVRKRKINLLICLLFCFALQAQTKITIEADFDPENKMISVNQSILFTNTSNKTLSEIYLLDWNHAYSDNESLLAVRFAEEFNNKFHFAKDKEKGITTINQISGNNEALNFERLANNLDIIKLQLNTTLNSGETIELKLDYTLKIPSSKFNRLGVNSKNEFQLKDWFIIPAMLQDDWVYFSNKDLDDQYVDFFDIQLIASYPKDYTLHTGYSNVFVQTQKTDSQKAVLKDQKSLDRKLYLVKENDFYEVETDKFTLVTNISDEGLSKVAKSLIVDRIAFFLDDHLGDYPKKRVFITEEEYKKNPIYGLNQLPNFIRPFPDGFQYELKILKTITSEYIDNSILLNERADYWIKDAIQVRLLMEYIEEFYPELNLLGSFSKIWGIKSFHAAQLKFNDQYSFLFLNMARQQIDQPLTSPKDSLIKYNNNIANKYKAGMGIQYLEDYLEGDIVKNGIKEYFTNSTLKQTRSKEFLELIQSKTEKDISWFYSDYVDSRQNIDYKIVSVEKQSDSLLVTIKNKTNSKVPVALYSIKNDSIIGKQWVEGLLDTKTIKVAHTDQEILVLNKEQIIADVNQGNNTKKLKGLKLFNKPIQVRLFQDIEDPNYSQVFFLPEFGFNIYDGFSPGIRFYNKTFLKRPLEYKIKPMYGLKSKEVIGSASIKYTLNNKFKNNYAIQFGFSGSTFHYEENLSYRRFSPFINFISRDQKNLRSNKKELFNIRYISVQREQSPTIITDDAEPDYG